MHWEQQQQQIVRTESFIDPLETSRQQPPNYFAVGVGADIDTTATGVHQTILQSQDRYKDGPGISTDAEHEGPIRRR